MRQEHADAPAERRVFCPRAAESLETTSPEAREIGAQIRRILLDSANQDLSPAAELLLYFRLRARKTSKN